MRRGWTLVALLALAAPASAGEEERDVDVLSYDLRVGIGETGILGNARIRIRVHRPPEAWTLELADEMTVDGVTGAARVSPEGRPGPVVLDLSRTVGPGAEHTVEVSFRGRPWNRFSADRGGFLRTQVSPEIAYIRSQYAWHPRVEDDPAHYRLEIMARSDWLVRTAGRQMEPPVDFPSAPGRAPKRIGEFDEGERMRRWLFHSPRPFRRVGLAAGPWVRLKESGDGFLLDALVEEVDSRGGRSLLGTARRALDHYRGRWGWLEGDRFTLVEMPAAFGERSGYSEEGYFLLGKGAFEAAAAGEPDRGLVAHEVAHAWWGGRVPFARFASESLASFGALGFLEKDRGEDAARAERARAVEAVARVAAEGRGVPFGAIAPWGRGMDPEVYRVHAYEKGMMVLQMVADAAGREKVDAALAALLEARAERTTDWADLAAALGKVSPRARAILEQWDGPEIPRLSLAFEAKGAGSRWRVEGTLSQEGTKTPFRLEVPVVAVCGERKVEHLVRLSGSEAPVRFEVPARPDAVAIDPDYRILAGRRTEGGLDPQAILDAAFKVVNSPRDADPERCAGAIEALRGLLARGAGEHEGLCRTGIGRCLFRTGDLEGAAEELEAALRLGGGGPFHRSWIHLRLGCIADLKGRRTEALDHYEKARGPGASGAAAALAKRFAERAYRGFAEDG